MMRASGILLPISSIPSNYGIGCFSKEAYEFVDQLVEAGQKYWQILPLGPTGYGDSPYQSFSTFAGNPYFVDLEEFIQLDLLTAEECMACDWGGSRSYVDYEKVYQSRFSLLRKAYQRFYQMDGKNRQLHLLREEMEAFEKEQGFWLSDYCLYMAVKDSLNGIAWNEWPKELKTREEKSLEKAREELKEEISFYAFLQFWFYRQWRQLKKYANDRGIHIIGDLPIYVAFDGADAWANPDLFQFDEDAVPVAVAGCPPDAFSETGQLWGNPLYNWEYHKKTGYNWWILRMKQCMKLYDKVRIDHFRGFDEFWAVPYGDETAANGKWEKGPGLELFQVLEKNIPDLDVIAEDLGFLTDSVRKLLADSGYPGMKVLQFAFDESGESVYLPFFYEKNCVVYTGTHDNETTKGWLGNLPEGTRRFAEQYIDCEGKTAEECVWGMIRAAQSSVADLCVIPLQDYLCLGNEARMNMPSTIGTNWKWRLTRGQLQSRTIEKIYAMTRLYGRIRENKK